MYNTNTIAAKDGKYMLEAQSNLCSMILHAFKKYWNENGNAICAGLASMNGDYRTAAVLMRK